MIKNLVALLQQTEGSEEMNVKRKQFAMYNFELLSEYHLDQDLIVQNSTQFMELFTKTLQEPNIHIKVASLKAITCFLQSIDDEEVVLKYKGMMNGLLEVVISVMKEDETGAGKESLESLIELTSTYAEIWEDCAPNLIYIVSEVIKNRGFEDTTRTSALEILGTLAENTPALLRSNVDSLKTHLFPGMCLMMTEIENADDLEAWATEEDTEL